MQRTFVTITATILLALCQVAAAAPRAATPKTAASKAAGPQGDPIAKAKALFQRYVELEHAFDPAQADLYADDAVIRNRRIMPGGQIVPLTIPASRYKNVVREGMPEARKRGDVANYTNDTYALEGKRVRIHVTRYLALKKYSSPMSMLVGPDATGKWVIFEEESESHMARP
jgi:hypothetical protein